MNSLFNSSESFSVDIDELDNTDTDRRNTNIGVQFVDVDTDDSYQQATVNLPAPNNFSDKLSFADRTNTFTDGGNSLSNQASDVSNMKQHKFFQPSV